MSLFQNSVSFEKGFPCLYSYMNRGIQSVVPANGPKEATLIFFVLFFYKEVILKLKFPNNSIFFQVAAKAAPIRSEGTYGFLQKKFQSGNLKSPGSPPGLFFTCEPPYFLSNGLAAGLGAAGFAATGFLAAGFFAAGFLSSGIKTP